VRQQGIEVLNGMCCDARKNIAEPRERINLHQFAGRYKAPQDGHDLAATIAAQEDPVVPTYCHHASILPISGRKLRFTIVGTRFTVDDCGCSTANSV
jgi:hypothetical protein